MRGFLVILILVMVLIYALWMINSRSKTSGEQDTLARERAMVELTRVNLATLERFILLFLGEEGRTPSSLEELRKSQILTAAAVDAWGREIHYERVSESSFRLTSAGPDGVFGTADDLIKTH